ncbi:hypothetical protein HRR83_007865 [Exophiala dermatitidis]|uniref:Uncharacterized protein n=2 Tax=Exophiala dermatitidis TaxID=5970 RepID=H6BU72_EXODN|nr:uncharacterized protein HMPREF1120_03779 [Exophiala dermatitidis NIH/UT8656]KAJ4506613.1 hypothetical protein HRR75_006855 [Exophiala dermatitidis]EHY55649.1 hypothetical protein HMPREF1120_03779 [Exophiala dermatitidis NIH/UT8656]KAJ4508888.1 hypothetical protein HRR74_007480 [Exophiala dermatitidis]KAJ4510140.1 hypothetical protein HRR73_006938 [Exophiala dermatitidis]KAJ4539144.1 hypothetical protein HRR77_006559 [Exophiala dermatitidis]
MAPREHSRSRGSFSIFSLDHVRSISRAGSRQAARVPSRADLHERSDSRLSYRCDPLNQPPASPGHPSETEAAEGGLGSTSPERKANGTATDMSSGNREAALPDAGGSHRRVQRTRRLSWLPFRRSSSQSRHPRSRSVQLPKATSTSTVARSVISAPILTSTSNVKVARVEGVHCSELTDAELSSPTWHSHVGQAAIPTGTQENCANLHEQQNSGHPASSSRTRDDSNPADAVGRRGRMLRPWDAVKNKFKSSSLRRQNEQHAQNGTVDGLGGQEIVSFEQGIARRRTEALNLYRGKIKGLTGNGHIRRKPVNSGKEASGNKEDPPLLGDIIDEVVPDENAEQSDNDSAFGSLTRSFASAVDKLDFHASRPHNIPFLRSRSSFFNSRRDKEAVERGEAGRQALTTSNSLRSPAARLPSSSSPVTVSHGPSTPAPAARTPGDKLAPQSTPSTSVLSANNKNGTVQSKSTHGIQEPWNPLRMHPPHLMGSPPLLEGRPVQTTLEKCPTPSQQDAEDKNSSRQDEDDNESLSLEDAPIYSPSLGDLSQYARDTPASKANQRRGAESYLHSSHTTPNPTPTRGQAIGGHHSGVLKKSRSGIGMFSRSKSVKILTGHHPKSAGAGTTGTATPVTPSPLSQRDINRGVSTGDGRTVKKSRSLHFGGLFKRPSESDLATSIPRDLSVPFQPATPSPLRNVTRAHGSHGKVLSRTPDRRSASAR